MSPLLSLPQSEKDMEGIETALKEMKVETVKMEKEGDAPTGVEFGVE
jgi:hypothetical protein